MIPRRWPPFLIKTSLTPTIGQQVQDGTIERVASSAIP